MAELKVEAPLAKFETEEDCVDFSDFQCSFDVQNRNVSASNKSSLTNTPDNIGFSENYNDAFSASLEDLVNTFDEKITKCFHNYNERTENYAPIQVRTQDEIMNECQMWWTLTGNFGNILPIDWSKSYTCKKQRIALNLNQNENNNAPTSSGGTNYRQYSQLKSTDSPDNGRCLFSDDELSLEDEDELAKDLDLHALIISSNPQQEEPMFTAEDVLEEIDELMQDSPTAEEPDYDDDSDTVSCDHTTATASSTTTPSCNPGHRLSYSEDKLGAMTPTQLQDLIDGMEHNIQVNSETLISELALRDELEYEKELKNTFISLLISVQNKRRQYNMEKKKKGGVYLGTGRGGVKTGELKYLTTVIPYNSESGPQTNQTLQVLIKILQAISEDSPTVPTLLTDYILKVLCPTS